MSEYPDTEIKIEGIKTWPKYYQDNAKEIQKNSEYIDPKTEKPDYPVNVKINDKVSLWKGDITRLPIDAIVNAANRSLLGGGGVDGCIHRAAGSGLLEECRKLNGCDTGDAKITLGYKLPARYVIHTVGPIGKNEKALKNCYKNCLRLALENKLRTLAFCCISTGIYGYPNRDAAEVALNTTREWLKVERNANAIDRIIFCLFLEKDIQIYHTLMLKYFPLEELKKPAEETTEVPATPEKDIKATEIKESGKKELTVDYAKQRDENLGTESEKEVESETKVGKEENKKMETEQNKENGDVKATDTPLGAGEDASSLKAEGTKNKEKEMEKVEEMQKGRKVEENEKASAGTPVNPPKKKKHHDINETKDQGDVKMIEGDSQAKEKQIMDDKKQDEKMDVEDLPKQTDEKDELIRDEEKTEIVYETVV